MVSISLSCLSSKLSRLSLLSARHTNISRLTPIVVATTTKNVLPKSIFSPTFPRVSLAATRAIASGINDEDDNVLKPQVTKKQKKNVSEKPKVSLNVSFKATRVVSCTSISNVDSIHASRHTRQRLRMRTEMILTPRINKISRFCSIMIV